MFVAGVLRFSGWRPQRHEEQGRAAAAARRPARAHADAGRRQRVPLEAGRAHLAHRRRAARLRLRRAQCDDAARRLDTVWQLLGKDADRVDVLWLRRPLPAGGPRARRRCACSQPTPALRDGLPRVGRRRRGVPVYVIDPNGFVVLRYAPGFDPAGLRTDLARLLKLK